MKYVVTKLQSTVGSENLSSYQTASLPGWCTASLVTRGLGSALKSRAHSILDAVKGHSRRGSVSMLAMWHSTVRGRLRNLLVSILGCQAMPTVTWWPCPLRGWALSAGLCWRPGKDIGSRSIMWWRPYQLMTLKVAWTWGRDYLLLLAFKLNFIFPTPYWTLVEV